MLTSQSSVLLTNLLTYLFTDLLTNLLTDLLADLLTDFDWQAECDKITQLQVLGLHDAVLGGQGAKFKHDHRRGALGTLAGATAAWWVYQRIADAVAVANRAAFHYDEITADITNGSQYEPIQMAIYPADVRGHYSWHHDDGAGESAERTWFHRVVLHAAPLMFISSRTRVHIVCCSTRRVYRGFDRLPNPSCLCRHRRSVSQVVTHGESE
jgi:hypothetical protein